MATFSVGQVVTGILLALLILIGVDATRWQNRATSLESSVGPRIAQKLINADRSDTKQSYGGQDQPYDFENKVLTLLLSAATLGILGFQAWIYWRQRGIMIDQLKAIHRQADITERALISAERAFVFVKSIAAAGVPGDDGVVCRWEFMARWTNSGATPARRVLLHTSVYTSAANIPETFDYPNQTESEEAIDTHPTTIGPGEIRLSNPKSIGLTDLHHAYHRRQRVFLYGWLDYADIFPSTNLHRTEFCTEIIVKVDPGIAVVSQGGVVQTGNMFMFRSTGRHNGAEDECYRKPGQSIRKVSFEQPSWPPPHGTSPV